MNVICLFLVVAPLLTSSASASPVLAQLRGAVQRAAAAGSMIAPLSAQPVPPVRVAMEATVSKLTASPPTSNNNNNNYPGAVVKSSSASSPVVDNLKTASDIIKGVRRDVHVQHEQGHENSKNNKKYVLQRSLTHWFTDKLGRKTKEPTQLGRWGSASQGYKFANRNLDLIDSDYAPSGVPMTSNKAHDYDQGGNQHGNHAAERGDSQQIPTPPQDKPQKLQRSMTAWLAQKWERKDDHKTALGRWGSASHGDKFTNRNLDLIDSDYAPSEPMHAVFGSDKYAMKGDRMA